MPENQIATNTRIRISRGANRVISISESTNPIGVFLAKRDNSLTIHNLSGFYATTSQSLSSKFVYSWQKNIVYICFLVPHYLIHFLRSFFRPRPPIFVYSWQKITSTFVFTWYITLNHLLDQLLLKSGYIIIRVFVAKGRTSHDR